MMKTIDNDYIKYKQFTENEDLLVTKNLNYHDKDYTISITGCFDYIKSRKQLEKRYRHLIPYSRQFITNEIVEK